VRSKERDGNFWCGVVLSVGVCIVTGLVVWSEYEARHSHKAIEELVRQIEYSGDEVALVKGDRLPEGKVVYLYDVHLQADAPVFDDDFGLRFDNAASVRRVTEYCQWVEVQHRSREKVGETAEGDDIMEEYVSYTYHLGWRSHRIPSLFFDSPVAYNNPQRDPSPSYEMTTRGTLAGGVVLEAADLSELPPSSLYRIPDDVVQTPTAYHNNFVTHDRSHFYSPYVESGVAAGVMSYLIDGIIDTGIRGDCGAGDIRVSFEVTPYPDTVSLIAKAEDGGTRLGRAPAGTTTLLLNAIGPASPSDIATLAAAKVENGRFWWLVGGVVSLLIWAIAMAWLKPFSASATHRKQA